MHLKDTSKHLWMLENHIKMYSMQLYSSWSTSDYNSTCHRITTIMCQLTAETILQFSIRLWCKKTIAFPEPPESQNWIFWRLWRLFQISSEKRL